LRLYEALSALKGPEHKAPARFALHAGGRKGACIILWLVRRSLQKPDSTPCLPDSRRLLAAAQDPEHEPTGCDQGRMQ
ncbi:hypothetical protein ABTC49_19120, partial [Acinetobacter baumannii]